MKKIDKVKKQLKLTVTAESIGQNAQVKVAVQVPQDLLSNYETLVQYRVEPALPKLIENLILEGLGNTIAAADDRIAEAFQSLKPARKSRAKSKTKKDLPQQVTPLRPAAVASKG